MTKNYLWLKMKDNIFTNIEDKMSDEILKEFSEFTNSVIIHSLVNKLGFLYPNTPVEMIGDAIIREMEINNRPV
ncbi:MAG: hypothetical protein Q8S52_09665 [Methylobacter sp.]|nr:hypothetical protein [Methylobacter sp.]